MRSVLPFVAVVVAVLAGCTRSTPLPVFGQIPQFELTAQTGMPFDSREIDGHVWVANFVFTTCPGPCPMMSHHMHGIQEATAATAGIKLISFTVDPAHDTPPVLAEYARRF